MIEFYGVKDVYSESGVDLTLLRRNLQRTVEDRWEHNRRAAGFAWHLSRCAPPNVQRLQGIDDLPPIFHPLCLWQELTRAGVEAVIVGGQAMVIHGAAHVSFDLDVCCPHLPEPEALLRS